jgi:hypothetical protein
MQSRKTELGAEARWSTACVLLYHGAAKKSEDQKGRCAEEIGHFM